MYRSCLQYSRNIDFYTVLADEPDGYIDVNNYDFPIISYKKLLSSNLIERMTGYYTAYEFCNSLKPFAHNYFLNLSGVTESLYLDSDIYITGNINLLFNEFNDASIVLSPHMMKLGCENDLTEVIELALLKMGVFNGGCLLVRKCEESYAFLNWWMSRLQWHCLHCAPGIEVDQSWLNFVPAYCPNSKVSRLIGANIAYWNLHQRPLKYEEGMGYKVAGKQAIFFHLSKWKWTSPNKLTPWDKYNPMQNCETEWQKLLSEYTDLLLSCDIEETSNFEYTFSRAYDGCIITNSMRREYLKHSKVNNDDFKSVFSHPEFFQNNLIKEKKINGNILSNIFSKFK
jgi:hypothetical protein